MTTTEQVQEIKRSFRLMMDGYIAQSMRDKGLYYHLNWGVTLPRLREKADSYGKNYELAIALWKENVRECKILATMLMPAEKMQPEVVDIWMEQTPSVEIAEQAAFNLYQYLPFITDKAYKWLASSNAMPQICGYHVLSRLFKNHQEPNERAINEFMDQALTALQSQNLTLRKAAMQAVIHFSDLGLMYSRLAQSAIHKIGLNFL